MIYLAGPLFTTAEREFNSSLSSSLHDITGEDIYLPQNVCDGLIDPSDIFSCCIDGIEKSDLVVAILDGPDSDSGTCYEVGYAYAKGKPIIGIRTDFRQCGDTGGLNLMLSESCSHIVHLSSLEKTTTVKAIAEETAKAIKQLKSF